MGAAAEATMDSPSLPLLVTCSHDPDRSESNGAIFPQRSRPSAERARESDWAKLPHHQIHFFVRLFDTCNLQYEGQPPGHGRSAQHYFITQPGRVRSPATWTARSLTLLFHWFRLAAGRWAGPLDAAGCSKCNVRNIAYARP